MSEESKKILEFLKEFDDVRKQKILIECTSNIGTKEWQDSIKDLWRRMLELDNKKSNR